VVAFHSFIHPHFSATLQDLYSKCREVFRKLRAEDEMLKKHVLYYDLQSILYSLDQLAIPEVGSTLLSWFSFLPLNTPTYRDRPTRW